MKMKEYQEFKNLVFHNKRNIKYKRIRIELEDQEYIFTITGAGNKAIKLETFIPYEDIFTNNDAGIIEKKLNEIINTIYEHKTTTIGDKKVYN